MRTGRSPPCAAPDKRLPARSDSLEADARTAAADDWTAGAPDAAAAMPVHPNTTAGVPHVERPRHAEAAGLGETRSMPGLPAGAGTECAGMDDYPLLNLFWTMLWFFLWIMWLFLLFKVIGDIFRDHSLNGWAKAGWLILCIVLPYLGVLIYVIARGKSMGERDVKRAKESEAAFQDYIRKTAGPQDGTGTAAHELARLAELKDKGAITPEEFEKAKAKVLA